jgi:hypothetical protein
VRFRSRAARSADRQKRLLAECGEWHTRFAWFPIRVWVSPGYETVWLEFYRARYAKRLLTGKGLYYGWICAHVEDLDTWPKAREES